MMKEIGVGDACISLVGSECSKFDVIAALFRFIADHHAIRTRGFKADYPNIAVSDVF